jgi:predicted RNA binding protein YcfA (HicA-like mRNA interferase family)
MNWDKYQGIKAADMIRVLRKLGYKQVGKGRKSVRVFENDEGNWVMTPSNPEEEMFSKSVWWILNLIRLPDKEFDRLRKGA